jgi:hypothetical protein
MPLGCKCLGLSNFSPAAFGYVVPFKSNRCPWNLSASCADAMANPAAIRHTTMSGYRLLFQMTPADPHNQHD